MSHVHGIRETGGIVSSLMATAGKTLTELMLVVVIVGTMAAMAAPSYLELSEQIQARTATAEIASILRMARQLAMARRERLLVRFDLPERTITLRRLDVDVALEVYRYADKGVRLDEPTAGTDLFFHPSGRSASATTIVIYDRHNRRTTVSVSLTGRVVIS